MQRLKLFIPLIVFIGLGLLLWRGLFLDPSAMPSALKGKPFPQFNLPVLQNPDKFVTVADLKGQPSLVNVWATWCVACRVEHPYLLRLAEQGVRIIGLDYKDTNASAKLWLQNLGNPYVFNIIDKDGRLGLDLGVFGAPETYLLDAAGVIRFKHVGVIDERVWRKKLEPVWDSLQP